MTTRLPYVLMVVASAIAGWLAFRAAAGGSLSGCGAGAGCGVALSSRWSYLAGVVPVSALGMLLYYLLIAAWHGGYCRLASCVEWVVVIAALWFVAVQAFVLHSFCPWCCTVHTLAVAAVVSRRVGSFAARRRDRSSVHLRPSPAARFVPPAAGFAAVVALAVAQALGPPPSNSRMVLTGSGRDPGNMEIADGVIRLFGTRGLVLDPMRLPVLDGPADWAAAPGAGVPLVFLHDWTCDHCRSLHAALGSEARSGARGFPVLVICLPAWRDPDAEEVHRLMLTAWLGTRPLYAAAEAAIVAGDLRASPAEVDRFFAERNSPAWPGIRKSLSPAVDSIMELGRAALAMADVRVSNSTLPQLVSARAILVGNPEPRTLVNYLSSVREEGPVFRPVQTAPSPSFPKVVAAPPVTNHSHIVFDRTRLDLGKVGRSESRNATFRFTNTGKETLAISSVAASCGCTAVGNWPRSVPPGGRGEVTAVFHAAGRPPGPQVKTLTLRSSAENQPVASLSIMVEVLPPEPAATPPATPGPEAPNPSAGIRHSEPIVSPETLPRSPAPGHVRDAGDPGGSTDAGGDPLTTHSPDIPK